MRTRPCTCGGLAWVGSAGASAVAMRPGVPDVTETVARAVGLSELATVAGLGCALVAMVGLAGGAALRSAGRTGPTPLLGLILTGLFGTYLAAGHLSNAAFAALFLISIAFLVDGRPASVIAAALALGAAGIAHPDFMWLSLAILFGAAALALVARRRPEAVMTAVVGVVGAGVTGVGVLAASTGGVAFDVPTSLDVFLLQTRQLARLHELFLERFPKVAGYALWAWLPLAALAYGRLRGHLGRLLVAWSAVTVAGVVAGLVWQPFPPHRIVAFAFCLPLLAAIGLAEIRAKIPAMGDADQRGRRRGDRRRRGMAVGAGAQAVHRPLGDAPRGGRARGRSDRRPGRRRSAPGRSRDRGPGDPGDQPPARGGAG